MLENKKFIQSSIKEILKDAIEISKISCNGIEAYPLLEYILQATFLKMTGYSEQKLKCICWDIASVDYDFRYKVYQHWSFGECSSIENKNDIFKTLIKQIQNYEVDFSKDNIKIFLDNKVSAKECFNFVKKSLKNSTLRLSMERDFNNFSKDGSFFNKSKTIYISDAKVLNKEEANDNEFSFVYEKLYKHRNRCAHNALSYQENLPKLNALVKKSSRDNYFYYFTILIILDEIFVALYKKLSSLILENNW